MPVNQTGAACLTSRLSTHVALPGMQHTQQQPAVTGYATSLAATRPGTQTMSWRTLPLKTCPLTTQRQVTTAIPYYQAGKVIAATIFHYYCKYCITTLTFHIMPVVLFGTYQTSPSTSFCTQRIIYVALAVCSTDGRIVIYSDAAASCSSSISDMHVALQDLLGWQA